MTQPKTITDVWRLFMNCSRHVKRGSQRGTTQVIMTTDDYAECLSVLATLADSLTGQGKE